MLPIANYKLKRKLSSNLLFNIYRCIRSEDKKQVIIKVPKKDHPTLEEITTLEHEYLILKKSVPGVIHAQDFIHFGDYPILVLQDSAGFSLKDYLENKKLNLTQFFDLAIQLTEILINLHKRNIIHKDITPANILIDPKSFKLQLLDLSFSTQLSEEMQDTFDLDKFEGSPAYMSPEQTGRTNRPIDYRTDFYSLGITFFEMLTGNLPFATQEILELVHCHLTKKPPKVNEIDGNIPEMLALIIEKMLAKLPEDRYASAIGIKADLQKCAKELKQQNAIPFFTLGTEDVYDHLQISHKIYGREKEKKELIHAIQEAKQGQASMIFITGYSGIGKTSLVREAQKPVVWKNSYFIQGKFDQLNKGTPYSAFVEAFQELVKQLLSEPEEKLFPLKEKLKTELNQIGQVITKLIPGFNDIIGNQEIEERLNPAEISNRFIAAMHKFIRAFTETDRLLVIFLDDLQWADNASLKLIEQLLINNPNDKLLLIGAYRDNEVDMNHPLQLTKNKLLDATALVKTLTLKPLKIKNVKTLLADTLHRPINDVESVANVVAEKTGCNPFFINEFLKTIYHEKLIYFSYPSHEWCWNTKKINEHTITENVVDLLTRKLHRLSADALTLLQISSCIGYKFDLKSLVTISGKSSKEVRKLLWEAIQSSFIRPLHNNQAFEMIEDDEKVFNNILNIEYQFIHDRIQQAVYQTIPDESREHTHLTIARMLLKEKAFTYNDERLFIIADHLNQCLLLIQSKQEKKAYSEYFLWAGIKAKESVAFETAIAYLRAGIKLNNTLPFNETKESFFALHKTLAECLYITGNFNIAHEELNHLLKLKFSKFQRSEIYSIKLLIYSVENKHELCIDNGIKALKNLGTHIPKYPNTLQILFEIFKVTLLLRRKDISNIIDKFPISDDAVQKARIYLLVQIVGSAYSINPNLVAYCIAKSAYLSLRYGLTQYTNLIGYGVLLIFELNLIKLGYRICQAQERLTKIWNNAIVDSKYYCARGLFYDHWFFPLSVGLDDAKLGYQRSIAVGDSAFAGYSKYAAIYNVRTHGESLNDLENEINAAFFAVKYIHDQEYLYIISLERLILEQLKMGQIPADTLYESYLQCVQKASSIVKRFAHITYGQLQFMLGNEQEAFSVLKKADKLQKFAKPFIWNQDFFAIYALLIVDHYPKMNFPQRMFFKWRLFYANRILKKWNAVYSPNINHKYLLVQAEMKKLAGDFIAAGNLYDEAILSAKKNNFLNFVGIINERAAKFYLTFNKPQFAKHYIFDAYHAFKRYGAAFKCQLLEKEYPQFFTNTETADSIDQHTSSLDLAAILKANQAISREINLADILGKIMQIVLQEAGVEKAILLRKHGESWIIEARQDENQLKIHDKNLVFTNSRDIPLSLISYTDRSKDTLIIQDTISEIENSEDPYLLTVKPKSILVLPILFQNEVKRVLYLENNACNNAFSQRQISSLKLLASQAAISLENADYYDKSGRFVPFEFLQRLQKKSFIDVQLGDQVQASLSVLFCDIRNFTALSHQLTPKETLAYANDFWALVEPIITAHGGFIDKYIGDGIMALFDDPPDQALKAAIEMLTALEEFNHSRVQLNKPTYTIGIGINSGDVILGVVGTNKRMDSSVMGDVVNLASRIENLTKDYRTPLLISHATREKLHAPELFNLEEIEKTRVRGTQHFIKVWKVVLPPVK